MSAGAFSSIIKAIAVKWAATTALNGIPLYYGRSDETVVKTFPRAVFSQYLPDQPGYAFSAAKYTDEYQIQFDVFTTDPDQAATYLESIHTAFHRVSLTLDTGTWLFSLRTANLLLVDPHLNQNSLPVYHAVSRWRFVIDNQ